MKPTTCLLVVTAIRNRSNSYITDWLAAFKRRGDLQIVHVDVLKAGSGTRLTKALRQVDGTVLLHSVTADSLKPAATLKPFLMDRKSPLVVLLGNEINLPWAPLSEKIQFLADVGADVVGTQLLEGAGQYLYADTGARVLSVPHAVDPRQFRFQQPSKHLELRIGTRTAHYLPIIGDQDRPRFLDAVAATAARRGWTVDISDSRFVSGKWSEYLASLDVTISTEAGSFFTEPSDALVTEILDFVRLRNRTTSIPVSGVVSDLVRRMPWQLRQWLRQTMPKSIVTNDLKLLEDAPADEIIELFFSRKERSPEYTKALSSRHVEAASVGTPQLLLEGRYNDVLIPDVHYGSVKSDLSNLETWLDRLSDFDERRRMAEAARTHVEQGHTLDHRIESIQSALENSR